MRTEQNARPQPLKPATILAGTAKDGEVGPHLGKVDIAQNEKSYLFRVGLPGVRCNQRNIKCHIRITGRVTIEGWIISTGAFKDPSHVYQAKQQQLSPPGDFSISFNLPGHVDPRLVSLNFKPDGLLEGVVMKLRLPEFPDSLPVYQ